MNKNPTNPNYIQFGPSEMIVQFATDKGELRTNTTGEYFYRKFAGGPTERRFICANPDLERRLIDVGYRAGERVGISRQTRNRSVIWVVRLIDRLVDAPIAPPPTLKRTPPPLPVLPVPQAAPTPGQPGTSRQLPAPRLPAEKYAAPPTAWPEMEPYGNGHAPKPVARAQDNHAAPTPSDQTKQQLKEYLFDAVDIVIEAQAYAAKSGLLFTPAFAEIQDIATSLFIQRSKQSNIDQMDRNQQRRANGGADPWRH